MNSLEDLERRVRERGVRVEERLALVRLLAREDAARELGRRQEELLAEVRRAAAELRREAPGG